MTVEGTASYALPKIWKLDPAISGRLGYQHGDAEDTHYQAVTVAQTRAVAEKYLRPDTLVIATIGPEK